MTSSFSTLALALLRRRAAERLSALDSKARPSVCFADPAEFAREVLGIELWDAQAAIARSVYQVERTAAKSGHKVGKSTVAATVALHWVSDPERRPGARVVMSSASARQVDGILWREIKRLYKRADKRGKALGGLLYKRADRGLQHEDGREIVGFSTDAAEKVAGYSGAHMLFIVDEASGVDARLFNAIEGNLAGGGALLLLSNPTQLSGEFFDAFHGKRSFYNTFSLSSADTPNARYPDNKSLHIPGLATAAWCADKLRLWGPEDPRYLVRVLGEFPRASASQAVPRDLAQAAQERYPETPSTGPLVVGLDPARNGGDAPSLALRRGLRLLPLVTLAAGDGERVAGAALAAIREARASEGVSPWEVVEVRVDPIGVGASPLDFLRAAESSGELIHVVEVNAAESAEESEEYANKRAELVFGVRDWLSKGGALPPDAELLEDLCSAEYAIDPRGRVKVEPKDKIKGRLGRSPDKGDAAALAIWEPRAAAYESARPAGPARRTPR